MQSKNNSDSTSNLGDIKSPLLIFGGPYSNLQATQSLFLEAERLGISPKNMICTGDVVTYCADPQATVDLVRNSNTHAEQRIIRRIRECAG